ncbi:MAG: calcium-binding protein [Solirubrobacterales bacterium]
MASPRRRIALLAAPAALLAGLALPSAAAAAVTCDFTSGVLTVTVTDASPAVFLGREADPGDDVLVDDNADLSSPVTCTATPTVSTTALITVDETSSTNQATALTLNFVNGRLEPGLGAEGGTPEIEVTYQADADGSDELRIDGGTESADQSFQFGDIGGGMTGGDLNGDDDSDDMTLTGVDLLWFLNPGTGNDTFTGDGTGSASFTGPTAIDMRAFPSHGNETFRSGSAGGNFDGGPGNDGLVGGSGQDSFEMGQGNDTYDGGGGTQDFASYENFPSAAGVTIDLSQAGPQNTGPDTGIDQVSNAEHVVGTNGPDRVTGDNGDNMVFGGNLTNDAGSDIVNGLGGNDSVVGNAGNDFLIGGQGNDLIRGDAGNDTASFALGSTGPVTFSLDLAETGMAQTTGGAGNDTLVDGPLDADTDHDVENLTGSPFGDMLTGNALANRINVLDGILDTVDCVAAADGDEAIADEAGVDALSNCETIDNAPQTSIIAGPANGATVNDSTPTYTLMADETSNFQVRVDGGAFQACPANCSVGPLSDGTHALAVRAVDEDENGSADQTPATRTVTVSTFVPAPPTITPTPLAQTPVATENPECAILRAKLKKAKSKKKRRKIRRRLRKLGC